MGNFLRVCFKQQILGFITATFSGYRTFKFYALNNSNSFVRLGVLALCFLTSHLQAQVSENFDSGVPVEWSVFQSANGNISWVEDSDGLNGTQAVSVDLPSDNIGNGNSAEYFIVTPQFQTPENGEIHFYVKQGSVADWGSQFELRLSTAAQPDINGFNITIASFTEEELNLSSQLVYERRVVELPESIPVGLDIYLAFVAVNAQESDDGEGEKFFLDSVEVFTGCSELVLEDITVDNVTVTEAELSWSHPEATDFEVQILPTGGLPANSGIAVSGSSYELSNLDPETEYDVYLRAICDNGSVTEWQGPVTFKTLKYGLSCAFPIEVSDIQNDPYVLETNLAEWANPDIVFDTEGSNCLPGPTNYLRGDKIFLRYTATEDGLISMRQNVFVGNGSETNCYNGFSTLLLYDDCSEVGVNCLEADETQNPSTEAEISNFLVSAGESYIIVVSSQLSSGAGICLRLEIENFDCAPPTTFQFNNLSETEVNISWDNVGGFSTSWEYAAVPAGTTPPSSGSATNTNQVDLSGLTGGTNYDFYVRSNCGSGFGPWSRPFNFTTLCPAVPTPYFTDFANTDNDNDEPCWTSIDANSDGVDWYYLVPGYATLRTDDNPGNHDDYLVSPTVVFDGTPKRIRYKHRSTQGDSEYSVRLSTTGVGVDNFTTEILPATVISNSFEFSEIIVDIPENITGNVNIAWVVKPNDVENSLRISIDDVHIEDKPACPDPLDPFTLNIQEDSAWFAWTQGDEEDQWEVVIQDLGSGEPTEGGIITSDNFPFIASGLEPGNRYEYYVRAYCNDEEQSNWIGPVAFTTLCVDYDLPFFESFDTDDVDTQKFCWEVINNNNDDAEWFIDEQIVTLQAPFGGTLNGFDDYLVSPEINLNGLTVLSFDYRALWSFFTPAPRFGLEVLMSTTNTDPASFNVISPLEVFNNNDYETRRVYVDHQGPVYFALRVPPEFDLSLGFSILDINNVSVTEATGCPLPSNIILDNIGRDFAELSWTPAFQESDWNVSVVPAGSGTPGSGSLVSENTYLAEGLESNTSYDFYVQANCSSESSEWIGPLTFTTICDPFTTPFHETFDSDSETEGCWTIANNNEDNNKWELNNPILPFAGDQTAAILTATNGNSDDWLITPTITIQENQRLVFAYRVYEAFFIEDLDVRLSTSGIGIEEFTTELYSSLDEPDDFNTDEWRTKVINFPEGITGEVNIAFHVPFFPSEQLYRGLTLFLDDVRVEDIPDCAPVTNLNISDITDTTAQITWDANGSETSWEVIVQPTGEPEPGDTPNPDYIYQADSNSFEITGLDASSLYDVYVRPLCDDTSNYNWVGPEELLTKCSFENLCTYTFVLYSDFFGSATLDISQNNQVSQVLDFEGEEEGESFDVLLCSGVAFTAYFDPFGSYAPQYENHRFEIFNDEGELVYASPTALPLNAIVYEGVANCGEQSCPQPTDLDYSNDEFSWTPGGDETQWEVAVQRFQNGTIPQSGTIVNTASYTPTLNDYEDLNEISYEYFVRAVCSDDDSSYWSGPYAFVRNDSRNTAAELIPNSGEFCDEQMRQVTFINANVSPEDLSCANDINGDQWFKFTAQERVHMAMIYGYEGNFYHFSGEQPYPNIAMTLYKDNGAEGLEELGCSFDNVLMAMYSSELVIGDNYYLRLSLQEPVESTRIFNLCLQTPEDLCDVPTLNGGFEEPVLAGFSGVTSIMSLELVPGWRQNLSDPAQNQVFIWEGLNAPGFEPYEGTQCVQVLGVQGSTIDPNDPDIRGLYRDFDTSEITKYSFSYAHFGRELNNIIQLFAGPAEGPYTMISEHEASFSWDVIEGTYEVPEGQETTRFIFRAHQGDDIGNILDAIKFSPVVNIITEDHAVDCTNPETLLEAEGVGTWVADENNPGEVVFNDANSASTEISGFLMPGTYQFIWKTRYCEEVVEISYNGVADTPEVVSPLAYCLNAVAEPLSASDNSNYDLVWYTVPTGGTPSDETPTPDTSVAGEFAFYAAYVDTNGCEGPRAEILVTVSENIDPIIEFNYIDRCEVLAEDHIPALADGFYEGGVFSSNTLDVDPTTGVIDLTSVVAGPHEITYSYTGPEEGCILDASYTTTVEFGAATAPTVEFTYGADAICTIGMANLNPILGDSFSVGGTFSSETLNLDPVTGIIDLNDATAGVHEVTYTIAANADNCVLEGVYTVSVSIDTGASPEIDFSYAVDVLCFDSASLSPDFSQGFLIGGTFSSESGLDIDPGTGLINPSTSAMGNYTISYTYSGDSANCIASGTSSFNLAILDMIEIEVNQGCENGDYILSAQPLNDSFEAAEAEYTWTNTQGNVVYEGQHFNLSDYAASNPDATGAAEYAVSVTFGSCTNQLTVMALRSSCQDIQRGISPDGNGKNDTFDLSGLGVIELQIFSRNGNEVYKYNGAYTNQWGGQSSSGDLLPDGTYFYAIRTTEGEAITGWVYINSPN